ncbi:MAG: NADH-quinone oxidoreductase subunit H [Candidatus Verstraetearchaeota archaeon]|nr:NADH-quinone oxidoreductase subunit H [Candidatus Verstraetearchaeota archaeon]
MKMTVEEAALFLATLTASSVTAAAVAALYSLVLPGIERKIQARIQQRIGPPILTPGLWSVLKFGYKKRIMPSAQIPRFYNSIVYFGLGIVVLLFLFSTPYWWAVLGWGSLLGIAGLLKIEEVLYVLMGSQSQSFLTTGMPVPDLAKGSKHTNIRREYAEQHSAERALKMMAIGSLPLYLALLVPFAAAKSGLISAVVSMQNPSYAPNSGWLWISLPSNPLIFTLPGILAAIVFFVGYVMLLNEKPFSILKAKVDVIEGGVLEYASSLRAYYYLMRNVLLFALSSIFVTLFVGIPFDPFMPLMMALNLVLSLVLPMMLAVLVAFSPILTFRQIYPATIGVSAIGVLALLLSLAV